MAQKKSAAAGRTAKPAGNSVKPAKAASWDTWMVPGICGKPDAK